MTDDKNFKRLVRARMAEAGESYTEAMDALRRGRVAAGPIRSPGMPASS